MASRAPVDKGWAWVVCFALAGIFGLNGSLNRCKGMLLVELQEIFPDASAIALLWVLKLNMVVAKITGPLNGYLISRTSHRTAAMVGGFLTSISIISFGYIPMVELMYPVMGVLFGEGAGLASLVSFTASSHYFDKRKALALGLISAGSGVGSMIMPPLLRALLDNFPFSSAMLLFGGIFLHFLVLGSLLRPISFYQRGENCEQTSGHNTNENIEKMSESADEEIEMDKLCTPEQELDQTSILYHSANDIAGSIKVLDAITSERNNNDTVKVAKKGKLDLKIAFSAKTVLVGVSSLCFSMGTGVIFQCFPPLGKASGISKDTVAIMLTCAAVVEVPCKILNGVIADRKYISAVMQLSLYMVLTGIGSLLCAIISGQIGMILVIAGMSVFGISVFSLIPVAMGELLGQENVTSAMSINYIYQAIAVIVTTFSAGLIYESSGRWEYVYLFSAVFCFCGGAINILPALYKTLSRYRSSKRGI